MVNDGFSMAQVIYSILLNGKTSVNDQMDGHVKRSGHDLSQYAIPIIACRERAKP
jgi:hypothetical protein